LVPQTPDSPETGDPIRKEHVVAYDDLKAGLAQRLGVTEPDADDETLLAALDEALDERAEPAEAIPEGTQLIDAHVLADLQGAAAAGQQALAEQARVRRDSIVDSALQTGRIKAASREQWRAALDENEESASKLLASLAPNTTPVIEIGHQVERDSDDALYEAAWPEAKKEA